MEADAPQDDNLRVRAVLLSLFALCMAHYETSKHLFFRCPFAVHLWDWLGFKLRRQVDLFTAAIIHTLHSIWMALNILRFSSG